MNKVTKVSKRFIRKVKGVINYETVKNYLRSQGYDIMIYNNGTTNYLLQELELEEYANTKQAFTVLNDDKGVVFVNYNNQNKLCSLIHETGHILLGHVTENEYFSETREQELEAETFAYHAMNYKKPNSFLSAILCVCLLMLTVFGIYEIRTDVAADFTQNTDTEEVSSVREVSTPTSPNVVLAENHERQITVIQKSRNADTVPPTDISHSETVVKSVETITNDAENVVDDPAQPIIEPQNSSTTYNTVTNTPGSEAIEEFVYITPYGKKYHKEICFYVRNKNCTRIIQCEAEKNYDACLVCNP